MAVLLAPLYWEQSLYFSWYHVESKRRQAEVTIICLEASHMENNLVTTAITLEVSHMENKLVTTAISL